MKSPGANLGRSEFLRCFSPISSQVRGRSKEKTGRWRPVSRTIRKCQSSSVRW